MSEEAIVADYALDIPDIPSDRMASLEKRIIELCMADEEEEERRRRERMADLSRRASLSAHSNAPRQIAGNWNDAIGGGLSLALGSDAYKEYTRDRMGMDEFEQERADLSEIGFGTKGDLQAPGADEWHGELADDLAQQDAVTEEGNELQVSKGQFGIRDRMQAHVIKGIEAENIIRMAQELSAGTDSPMDDEFVADTLPGILEHKVDDMGIRDLAKDRSITEKVVQTIADIEMDH